LSADGGLTCDYPATAVLTQVDGRKRRPRYACIELGEAPMCFTGAFSYLLVWLLVGVTMGSWSQQCSSGRWPPQPPRTVNNR